MPVRTAYVGTEAVGDVLTKANFDKLPGGWIGYAEVTANQGSITAAVDLTGLTVTVTVGTNRRLCITAQAQFQNTIAGDGALFSIQEGATVLSGVVGAHPLANTALTLNNRSVITPTAGTHTYKLTAQSQTGGTVTMGAGATFPASILVEDIGPAS